MNLKKLEKATRLFEQIKQLDREIIEIDQFAMLAANGSIKSSFDLKIEDLSKQKEEAEKVEFDEDGSLIKPGTSERPLRSQYFTFFAIDNSVRQVQENKHVKVLSCDLTENATLQILGVLLYEKQSRRQQLIKQLESYGVAI